MLCSSCSRSSDENARYCSGCGQPLFQQPPYPRGPLVRAREGRLIAGVCAGFAHALGFDVTLTRLVVCLLALFSGGTVFVAYILAWIIMPQALYALPASTTGIPVS